MVTYTTGSIFNGDAQAIVTPVDCKGMPDKNTSALRLKKAYPENFKNYRLACKRNLIIPGRIFLFETGKKNYPHFILNFPVKDAADEPVRLEDIQAGLEDLARIIIENKIKSIALPLLDTGEIGLDQDKVRQCINTVLEPLSDVHITVLDPET